MSDSKDNKDDKPAVAATAKEIRDVMSAVEQFKEANDARLSEIEKKGSADPLVEEKLAKINTTLDGFEKISQRLATAEAKAAEIEKLQKSYDELETAFKRSPSAALEAKAGRGDAWTKAVVAAYVHGDMNLPPEQRKTLDDITAEYKALAISPDTAGGYLAPAEYVREIIKGVTEMSPVRSLARVRQTSAKSVEIPKRTGQFAAVMASEMSTRSETTGLTYGMWEIPTHEMVAIVDLTNWMMEDAVFNMEAEVASESAEQFAVKEGQLFVTGTGVGEPEGFMTATGVSSTSSGAATTVTADALITMKHAIKTAYTRNANFLLNRTTLGSVRKLKDGSGQYLWMPGIAQGRPNSIDGDSYVEVPDMPSEGAGLKPVAYGDFRQAYTWIDRLQMIMLRDPYTQAGSGKVRMWMRKRIGGQVTLAEAIQTMTCEV